MLDAAAFGQELASMVKAQFAPVLARLDALEKRLDDMPAPKDGKDADPEAVVAIVREQVKGDLAELRSAVDAIVIPEPVTLPDIPALVAEAIKSIPVPKNGEDGKSLTADDVAPLIRDEVAKAVSAIPAAKDGVGLAGALIDREGNLVVTLSNGEAKTLGPVVGKDAEPAQPGRDGLGFDDMCFEEKDGRLYAVFRRGDVAKEARLPGISYRGVWKSGEYLTGDSVTFGACQWIATQDTDEKPGEGRAWQLAVRKGRDGRDGEAKPAKAAEPIRVGVPKGDK